MLSWQPSQEANFHTASFGLRGAAIRARAPSAAARRRSQGNTGPSLADERRPELAVPAEADRALHAALERDEDALRRHAALAAVPAAEKRIIDLGPADHRERVRPGRSPRAAISLVTNAHPPVPVGVAAVHGDLDLRRRSAPASARARAGRAARRASGRRRGRRRCRSARGARAAWWIAGRSGASPIPPATITTSPPSAVGERPGGAERPAHAHASPGPTRAQRRRRRPDRADRVHVRQRRSTRDRHLAGPERVEHRELAGREAGQPSAPRPARARASRCRRSRGAGARHAQRGRHHRARRCAQRPGWP